MTAVTIDAESLKEQIARARQGDRWAAERLVRAHEGWVRSAIYAVSGRRDEADDLAQQVWARALDRLDTLENPAQFRAWLYTIARNTAIDVGTAERRRRTKTTALERTTDLPERPQRGPAATAAGNELHATLLRAVQSLPALYREPFVLRHLQDWSYAEIGEVLGLTTETVETRLVRARRMLREMLQDKVEP